MLQRIITKIANCLMAVAATVLALIMFLTATDVVLRYVFNSPLPGTFELIEFMMAIMVPLGIVYCELERSHVAVDLLYEKLSKPGQAILDILTTTVTLAFAGLIAWKTVEYFLEVKASGLTSAVLLIPTYPFILPIAIGMAAFMLVSFLHLIEHIQEVKKS